MGIIEKAAAAAFEIQKMKEEAAELLAEACELEKRAKQNLLLAYEQGRVTRALVYFDPVDLHPTRGLLDLKVFTEDAIEFMVLSRFYPADPAGDSDERFFCYDSVTATAEVRVKQIEHQFLLVFKDTNSGEETHIPLVESGMG